jgi:hypothetical protein
VRQATHYLTHKATYLVFKNLTWCGAIAVKTETSFGVTFFCFQWRLGAEKRRQLQNNPQIRMCVYVCVCVCVCVYIYIYTYIFLLSRILNVVGYNMDKCSLELRPTTKYKIIKSQCFESWTLSSEASSTRGPVGRFSVILPHFLPLDGSSIQFLKRCSFKFV